MLMSVSSQQVEVVLKEIVDPYLGTDLITAKAIKRLAVDGGAVVLEVELGYPAQGYRNVLTTLLKDKLAAIVGVTSATVDVSWKIEAHGAQKGAKPIPNVKNLIAVASGKGGVGKSTVAVNLALALSVEGARVGILDADIYGPSQPRMLGAQTKPESKDGKTLEPVMSHGLQSMSIGYLIDEETPMIWR